MSKFNRIKSFILCMGLVLALAGCSSMASDTSSAANRLDIDYVGVDGEITEEEVTVEDEGLMSWLKKKLTSDKEDSKPSGREDTTAENQENEALRELYSQGKNESQTTQEEQEKAAETKQETKNDRRNDKSEEQSQQTPQTEDKGQNESKPVEEQPKEEQKEPENPVKKNTVTFTIRCDTAVNNGMHKESKWAGIVPASGCILPVTTLEFEDGDTVFDLLCEVRDTYKLQMEYSGANGGQYIEGINNLYEFDGGRWSGWMYCVNGWYPNYGCGQYVVRAGDVIEWNYTCDLGCDLENGDPNGYGQEWKDTHD